MSTKRQRPTTANSVAGNLRALMESTGWNQTELAKRSGVSQRHISDILNGRSQCTIPVANDLAVPFNLTGWHLLLPNLPKDLVSSPAIGKLVEAYIKADAAGRKFLEAAGIAAVLLVGCGPNFTDADIEQCKQSIRQEYGKKDGVTVEDVTLMKQSSRKLIGLVKLKIDLFGPQELTKSCTADMGEDGNYLWHCE